MESLKGQGKYFEIDALFDGEPVERTGVMCSQDRV